ncbi:unnamed protein product [Brachionus calyciflorus]|uniref:Uncharacterized protein n=1 Tax=Brachionus calyciflorus TaxID=104777 RepID=A0A814B6U1_9BILA|nr:unnamed protein product [Brachionus calyciflorus]
MSGFSELSFLANQFKIFKEDMISETVLKSAKDFAQMTLFDLTNGLAKHVKQQLKLENELKIVNRYKTQQIALDIWYLLTSLEEKKLQSGYDPTQNEYPQNVLFLKFHHYHPKQINPTYSNVCQQSNYKERYDIRQRIKKNRYVLGSRDNPEIKSASGNLAKIALMKTDEAQNALNSPIGAQ